MDVDARILEVVTAREREIAKSNLYQRQLEAARDTLEQLPYDFIVRPSTDKIVVTAYGNDPSDAKKLAATIRILLGEKESRKELDVYTGKMTYVTENEQILARVFGGDIPANCTLVPVESKYTIYKMQCLEEN